MSDLHTNLTLPSNPQQVSKVEPFVQDVATRYNLSPGIKGDLLVSLTEAVTNAILHGNGSDEAKHVSISCQHEKDSISVLVSDEGPGFDPAQVPDPTCPELLDCCGGRGLLLMRRLSYECCFSQGGRTVQMKFKIS